MVKELLKRQGCWHISKQAFIYVAFGIFQAMPRKPGWQGYCVSGW